MRPLAYSLLLGTLPPEKKLWKRTHRRNREKYYVRMRCCLLLA